MSGTRRRLSFTRKAKSSWTKKSRTTINSPLKTWKSSACVEPRSAEATWIKLCWVLKDMQLWWLSVRDLPNIVIPVQNSLKTSCELKDEKKTRNLAIEWPIFRKIRIVYSCGENLADQFSPTWSWLSTWWRLRKGQKLLSSSLGNCGDHKLART